MTEAVAQELGELLRSFKLKGFADHYGEVAALAEKEGFSHETFLLELARLEAQERRGRRVERLLRQANLPADKRLDTFDLARVPAVPKRLVRSLCQGEFLDRAENVLVFGNPGTGKSHLCWGIAHELVAAGRSVLHRPAYSLVQRLLVAKRELRLQTEIRKLDRFELLLIDDLGYVTQERDEMDVLFTLFAERYERRSVMITSNLVFSKWDQIFKDVMTTTAAIDRLVHHARILELNAESYRAEHAHQRRRRKGGAGEADEATAGGVRDKAASR